VETVPSSHGGSGWRGARPWIVGAFALLFALTCVSLVGFEAPLWGDDALFFFRYADNLAAGNGYRFNAEEPPVCGASAPLWPLVLAAVKLLGLSTPAACSLASVVLALVAILLLGLTAYRLHGVLGVLALAPILAVYHHFSSWCTSGMESPMTFALVAGAFALATGRGGWRATGLVGGLCLVHKLDLVPLGLVLLVGCFRWRREIATRALLLALVLAAAWYAWATWTFGSPLPNSFVSKLTTTYGSVPRSWFAHEAFLRGGGWLRSLLALVGVVALRRWPFLWTVALTHVLALTTAYTLRVPGEMFLWYVAAVSPALALLAASGLATLLGARAGERPTPRQLAVAAPVLLLVGVLLARGDFPLVRGRNAYLWSYQRLMMQAGQWVDRNTPPDARVITSWGYPAYYSRRFVYDASNLNRRPEPGSLFDHEPEVWIHAGFGELEDFVPRQPYELVHAYRSDEGVQPYFVAVLLRQEPPGD